MVGARKRLSGDRKGEEEGKDNEGMARIRPVERRQRYWDYGSVEHCTEKADTLE